MINKKNDQLIHAVALITTAYTVYYFIWRLTTFNPEAIWLSWIFYITELYGFFTFILFLLMTWKIINPKIEKPKSDFTVDIFIPTCGEPLDVLHATLIGCNKISYRHKTYLLDDSAREEVEKLAKRLGCIYIARPTHEGAKAGNINYALKISNGDLIVILDADFIPLPDILDKSLGFFNDTKVAIVQGPQIFYNLDSFQHESGSWHEQKLFYHVIQPGKNRNKSAFWCGSPSIVRRSALKEVNGVAEESVTEDIHTTIRLIKKGYYVLYSDQPIAVGIAPATLEDFLGQRFRWSQGAMQVMRSKDNPLWNRGFTLSQKLSFLASGLTYFDSIQKFIYLMIPIISLTTGLFPIREIGLPFMYRFIPYMVLGIVANYLLGRGFYNFWLIEIYNVIKMFSFIRSIATLFTGKAKKFTVTRKDAGSLEKRMSKKLMRPQIILFAITIIASIFAIAAFKLIPGFLGFTRNELVMMIFWAMFTSLLIMFGILKLNKISKRSRYRFPIKKFLYWKLSSNTNNLVSNEWYEGFSIDLSSVGLGIVQNEKSLRIGDAVEIKIPFRNSDNFGKHRSEIIHLKGIIAGIHNKANDQKNHKLGVVINSFDSYKDKSLYMEMLNQPVNLLRGEEAEITKDRIDDKRFSKIKISKKNKYKLYSDYT